MAYIELKSISGKGIKSLALFQKPSLYAAYSLTNANQPTEKKKNKKKTNVDRSNGENPVWDQPIRIDIDIGLNQDLILRFDLKTEALLADRVVGRAFIPVADLDFSGAVQHVSYQVKTPEGKTNGAINFSYKVDGPETATSQQIAPSSTPAVDYSPPAESVYPAASFAPSALAVSAYPPQPEDAWAYHPTVDPVVAYPPPGMAASGIYPPPMDTTITYPPLQSSTLDQGSSYPPLPPDVGGHYPLPAYPPHPASECCCRSIPQRATAYPPQPECCCQEIPQQAPAWYYPSAQHPATGSYYPPPPPDVYGYKQQG